MQLATYLIWTSREVYKANLSKLDKVRAAFLNGFNYCFLDSLPDELPPERSEDHSLDLVPGNVPRVDGRLAMSRAFGDATIKEHISAEPDIHEEWICEGDEFIILESDGISHVMDNKDAVELARNFNNPEAAAKALTREAAERGSLDDISAIIVFF
ncbi:hypothetical protein L7F22_013322 [Adiantum nelumboides]|nr:hypothetical protein [Adiantum nelumboides]